MHAMAYAACIVLFFKIFTCTFFDKMYLMLIQFCKISGNGHNVYRANF